MYTTFLNEPMSHVRSACIFFSYLARFIPDLSFKRFGTWGAQYMGFMYITYIYITN